MRGFFALCIVSLLLAVAGHSSAAPGSPTHPEVISGPTAPFTETFQQMVARDSAIRNQIALGLRPPLPLIRVAPKFRLSRPTGAVTPNAQQSAGEAEPSLLAAQSIGTSFIGFNLQDEFNVLSTGFIPPDTMGAVGPDHFVEMINGCFAVYNRTGTRLSALTLDSFFTFTSGAINYPRNGTSDPRMLYDRRSGRWFACCLEIGTTAAGNNILLAVSRTSDPMGTWDKYPIPVGMAQSGRNNYFTDFDTLGVDDNGVYFGMTMFPSLASMFAKIAVTPKAPLIALSPSIGAVTQFSNITDMYSSPQPAHNQDSIGPSDPAWIVSSSATTLANLEYRKVTWSGGTPSISGTSTVTTPAYANPLDVPASGSSINLDVGDDRMYHAVIRNGRLWTARHIGVNSSGGSSSADRTAGEWIELDVSAPTASLIQSGRVFDTAASNPRHYFYPSIMVNGRGDAAMGFSGSKSTEFVGAYASGRLASDPAGAMSVPTLIKGGQASYQRLDSATPPRNRWGDYSYTSLDPNDDMTIWTIQEYATNIGSSIWGTWVAGLTSPAPTLNNPNLLVCPGQVGAVLNLTGTGFYDPGPGYTDRLTVVLDGGAINGISGYVVTYNGPTSVTVTFNVAANATPGTRDIVLTNPDGQSVTVTGGVTVGSGPTIDVQPASQVACTGQTVTICVVASSTSPLSYQWARNFFEIPGATGSCYSIPTAATGDSGSYTVAVSTPCGSVTSAPALLQVGPCMTIAQAKQSPDGTFLALVGKSATAGFSDSFYVEESTRQIGLLIDWTGGGITDGIAADSAGTMQTASSGERFVQAVLAVPQGPSALTPRGMNGRAVGGADWLYNAGTGAGQQGVFGAFGLNNVGLFVKIWGKVTQVGIGYLYVDDGSRRADGTQTGLVNNVGIRVVCNPAGYSAGNKVAVEGISSCFRTTGGQVASEILTRRANDVVLLIAE